MKNILHIVGARPQFIKLVSLSKEIRIRNEEIIIHTGQHFDKNMSKIFFDDLGIPAPNINLEISGGGHGKQTGHMIIKLEEEIRKINPSIIIIYGDTNSTLAGSIVGSKLGIPIIHVEAGLRSFNRTMPEEINRIIADHTSDYLFAPTEAAMINLDKEGLSSKSFLTGDLMVDTLNQFIELAKNSNILKNQNLAKNNYYLLTLHRPYNVDNVQKLKKILENLSTLDNDVIFPIHPRTQKVIIENNINFNNRIKIINPLSYLDFLFLQFHSKRIITDSGGIQKEAYILSKPCITIRPETEWIETVNNGWNVLLDPYSDNFVEVIKSFNPQNERKEIFGKNVAKGMLELINTFN